MTVKEAFAKEAGNIGKDIRAPFQAELDKLVGIPKTLTRRLSEKKKSRPRDYRHD